MIRASCLSPTEFCESKMGDWLAKSDALFNLNDAPAIREVVMRSKLKLTPQISLAAVLVALIGTMRLIELTANASAQEPSPSVRSNGATQKHWDATAPGRVEPASQAIRIAAPIVGRIAEVLVKANDKVFAGELLIRLDDDEARARLAGTEAQVALHQRARNDERRKGSEERRREDDALAEAERSVVEAQAALDKAAAAKGAARSDELDAARATLSRAQAHFREQRDRLAAINAQGLPLPTRVEGELSVARADLMVAEVALEKTRIRTPLAGTVLQVQAKVGELALPSSEHPLVLLGDVSTLQVRAELDERDFVKVRVGQHVLVRAHAFRDREFQGRVSSIAQYVETGRMTSAEQRKLSDIDVAEVIVELTDPGPLVVGMQVDAYFSSEMPDQQGAR
jgi:HlyD family secretion protein